MAWQSLTREWEELPRRLGSLTSEDHQDAPDKGSFVP